MNCRLIFCLIGILIAFNHFPMAAHAVGITTSGVAVRKDVRSMQEIKREHLVTQSLDISCGPAGLATVLNYYLDDPVTEVEIINYLLNTVPLEKVKERKGFSLLDLKRFAQAKGYHVTGYKMDCDFLRGMSKPVLVPIKFRNFRHFVIVRGVLADRVFIADPTAGNISMKVDKFRKIWTDGIGLVIEKDRAGRAAGANKLELKAKDLASVVNYRDITRMVTNNIIRTTIYSGEF